MTDIKKVIIRLKKLHLTVRIYPTDYCNLNLSVRNDDYIMNRLLTLYDIDEYGLDGVLSMINDMIDKLEEAIENDNKRINRGDQETQRGI